MKKVFFALSPNADKNSLSIALKSFFNFLKKSDKKDLIKKLKRFYPFYENVEIFDSGRSALTSILRRLGKSNAEVVLPAYTCLVVVNAVRAAGYHPVFVEIEKNFSYNQKSLLSALTEKTAAVLIQSFFGLPHFGHDFVAEIKKKGIFVIEDLAHAFGENFFEGEKFRPDAVFSSLGTDKIVSTYHGGVAWHNLDSDKSLKEENFLRGWRALFSFWLSGSARLSEIVLVKKFWRFCRAIHLTEPIISNQEKLGLSKKINFLSPSLYSLLSYELDYLSENKSSRNRLFVMMKKSLRKDLQSEFLPSTCPALYFPVFIQNPEEVLQKLKQSGFVLPDSWLFSPIVPRTAEASLQISQRLSGTLAKEIASNLLLIPLFRTVDEDDLRKIIEIINSYGHPKNFSA